MWQRLVCSVQPVATNISRHQVTHSHPASGHLVRPELASSRSSKGVFQVPVFLFINSRLKKQQSFLMPDHSVDLQYFFKSFLVFDWKIEGYLTLLD